MLCLAQAGNSKVVWRCSQSTRKTCARLMPVSLDRCLGEDMTDGQKNAETPSAPLGGRCSALTEFMTLVVQDSTLNALKKGAPAHDLAPAWRMMLLSTGSVMHHLELLTGLRVEMVRAPQCPVLYQDVRRSVKHQTVHNVLCSGLPGFAVGCLYCAATLVLWEIVVNNIEAVWQCMALRTHTKK